MSAQDYNRSARFQLRLLPETLGDLKLRAQRAGVPLNHYIVSALETYSDDEHAYHLKMASKHAFMTYAMINVLAATLIPAESRREVMKAIGEQTDRLFGANPPLPEAVGRSVSNHDPNYVQELFLLFQRFASPR